MFGRYFGEMARHSQFSLCIALSLGLVGCDTFFIVDASVIDDNSGEPLAGATATLVLDKGFAEPTQTIQSAVDGSINLFMNEPAEAWATLTVEKQGYGTWSTQFQGISRFPFVIRLVPESGQREE